ncbi:13070_t:CDS:2 [Dentiscutata heterogama]|uniref:13070_t:CDS:1 n=1 Tax=Dentiscutata heterogama TaxID=1316150 RepID=A0ACA9MIC4_9GLOM|nr:13070_t:CDS:2 [Dentiscutata heterogama]
MIDSISLIGLEESVSLEGVSGGATPLISLIDKLDVLEVLEVPDVEATGALASSST